MNTQQNKLKESARRLCHAIEAIDPTKEALIVGGTVRDTLLDRPIHDVDIATNFLVEELEKHFRTHDIGKSKTFGIVALCFEDNVFEVANFRTDGEYTDGRRPDSVKIAQSFLEDSERRDFTINSMGITTDNKIIDHHNGRRDLIAGLIRTVGDPHQRFKEDKLRIIRAARFAAQLGFVIEDETLNAARIAAEQLTAVSGNRIREELYKAAESGPTLSKFILELENICALHVILPELTFLQPMPHSDDHHPEGGVWDHVHAAVRQSPSTDPVFNLAVLFHDLGKAVTLTFNEKGNPSYKGHAKIGVDIFKTIARRLQFSNADADSISFVIENHMIFHGFDELKKSTILQLRHNPHWLNLKNTIFCDDSSRMHCYNENLLLERFQKTEDIAKIFGEKQAFEARMKELFTGQDVLQLRPELDGTPEFGGLMVEVKKTIIARDFKITREEVLELVTKY